MLAHPNCIANYPQRQHNNKKKTRSKARWLQVNRQRASIAFNLFLCMCGVLCVCVECRLIKFPQTACDDDAHLDIHHTTWHDHRQAQNRFRWCSWNSFSTVFKEKQANTDLWVFMMFHKQSEECCTMWRVWSLHLLVSHVGLAIDGMKRWHICCGRALHLHTFLWKPGCFPLGDAVLYALIALMSTSVSNQTNKTHTLTHTNISWLTRFSWKCKNENVPFDQAILCVCTC